MIPKRILINDPDVELAGSMKDLLKRQGLSFDVIVTNDGSDALEVIRRMHIDLVITGLDGTAMDGFQLMAEINRQHRDVKVIVMVGSKTPLPRATIRYMGANTMFEKPFSLADMTKAVFAELQIRCKGEVWGIHLTSFLQMLHADGKTCALTVDSPGHTGRIFLKDGELVAAEDGETEGDAAFYSILSWDEPIIEIDYLPFNKTTSVSSGLISALMESQRRKDTDIMTVQQMRRHTRFKCLVVVDFDLENVSYRFLIRDMSEGGAFIETKMKVTMGEEMVMELFSIRHKTHASIRCKIVRIVGDGFGVQFLDMDDEKRAFLLSIREE